MKIPTVRQVEKAIGLPAVHWKGQCFAIASMMVDKGLVDGVAVYGHWLGEPGSYFSEGRGGRLPFVHHGWVKTPDGDVIDPTRWVFEDAEPYIYHGSPTDPWDVVPCRNCGLLDEEHDRDLDDCGHYERERWLYDEGGNQWKRLTLRPPPAVPAEADRQHGLAIGIYPKANGMLSMILSQHLRDDKLLRIPRVSIEQLLWIANAPYDLFLPFTAEVYAAIEQCGYGALVPMVNMERAQREHPEVFAQMTAWVASWDDEPSGVLASPPGAKTGTIREAITMALTAQKRSRRIAAKRKKAKPVKRAKPAKPKKRKARS